MEDQLKKGASRSKLQPRWKAAGRFLRRQPAGREVRILDAESGREVSRPLDVFRLSDMTFSLDGKYLATGQQDGTGESLGPCAGQETLTLKGHTGQVTAIEFSPDGHRLISASRTTPSHLGRHAAAGLERV